jgi:hypothetical protein
MELSLIRKPIVLLIIIRAASVGDQAMEAFLMADLTQSGPT